MADFREDRYTFKGTAVSASVPAGQTADIDLVVPAGGRCLAGVQVLTENAAFGDWVSCSVVDRDNVLGYGSGFVVALYASKWFVQPGAALISVFPGYISEPIPSGLVLRITYTSVGLVDTGVEVNYYLHLKK